MKPPVSQEEKHQWYEPETKSWSKGIWCVVCKIDQTEAKTPYCKSPTVKAEETPASPPGKIYSHIQGYGVDPKTDQRAEWETWDRWNVYDVEVIKELIEESNVALLEDLEDSLKMTMVDSNDRVRLVEWIRNKQAQHSTGWRKLKSGTGCLDIKQTPL